MTNAPTTRETADHAELAQLAEAASEGPWSLKEGSTPYPESDDADSWAAILTPRGHSVLTLYERYGVKGEDRSDYDDDARFIAAANPATVLALLSEIAALRGERDRLRNAASKSNEEVCQSLGKALGYPWFKDDQANFPGSTEEHGVCVGDHVAESIADEAARRLTQAERQRDELLNAWRDDGIDLEDFGRIVARLANQESDQ